MQDRSPITVDPASHTARAEGGALLADLDAATQAHGLATTTGVNNDTGLIGLTLGGGSPANHSCRDEGHVSLEASAKISDQRRCRSCAYKPRTGKHHVCKFIREWRARYRALRLVLSERGIAEGRDAFARRRTALGVLRKREPQARTHALGAPSRLLRWAGEGMPSLCLMGTHLGTRHADSIPNGDRQSRRGTPPAPQKKNPKPSTRLGFFGVASI